MSYIIKKNPSRFLLFLPSLIALLIFLWALPNSDLSKREAREGIPVVLMSQGDSLWVPKIHEEKIRTKPPLFYWSALLTSKLLGGVNEISLRLPSVLAGTGAVFLTTLLGFWLFSPVTGCMAGFILALSWRFYFLATHARIDMLFVFFITASFAAIWKMLSSTDVKAKNRASWIAAWALGLAVLAKGPLGLIFPLLSLFLYCRISGEGGVPWIRLIVVPLALTSLWATAALVSEDKTFPTMILQETVGRISGNAPIQMHKEPFYFYFPQIFLGLAPWSLILPAVAWNGLKTKMQDKHWLFPAVAAVTLFVFLSLFPGKRGDYLLPLYPMAALLISHFFSISINRTSNISIGLTAPSRILIVIILFLATVNFFLMGSSSINADNYLGFLNSGDRLMANLILQNHLPSWPFLVGGGLCMLFFAIGLIYAIKKNSTIGLWGGIAGWSLLILVIAYGPGARAENKFSSLKPFAEEVRQIVGNNPLINFGELREDIRFYIGLPIEEQFEKRTVENFLKQPNAYLLAQKSFSQYLFRPGSNYRVILETTRKFKTYQLIGNSVNRDN